jgi:hypothetical protein
MATTKSSVATCTVATVVLFAAVLAVAPAASARDCLWRLGPDLVLIQDNGLTVEGKTIDNQVVGPVRYAHTGGNDWTTGTLDGPAGLGPDGRTFSMKVNWTEGPGAGLSNTYNGRIKNNKTMLGTTTNNLGTVNGWEALYTAFCDEPPQPDLEVIPAPVLGTG